MAWVTLGRDISEALKEVADNPSDRVVAIVVTSVVDATLKRALENRFIESSLVPKIFNPTGLMGSIYAKYQLGYLMGMFDRAVRLALEGLGEIRNRFAHQLTVRSFDDNDTELTAAFRKLTLHSQYSEFPCPFNNMKTGVKVDQKPADKRALFFVNAQLCLTLITRDIYQHPPHTGQFIPFPEPSPTPVREGEHPT